MQKYKNAIKILNTASLILSAFVLCVSLFAQLVITTKSNETIAAYENEVAHHHNHDHEELSAINLILSNPIEIGSISNKLMGDETRKRSNANYQETLEDSAYSLAKNAVPAVCATCGCTVKFCGQCFPSKTINGETKYAANCGIYENKVGETWVKEPCPYNIQAWPWYQNIMKIVDVIDSLLTPIIIILGAAGSVLAIVLGVNYSKAENAEKREESKKRMIGAIIGLVATMVLLILAKLFTKNAGEVIAWINGVQYN